MLHRLLTVIFNRFDFRQWRSHRIRLAPVYARTRTGPAR